MIIRHKLRKAFHPRPALPGRKEERQAKASDIVLVMLAGLLVAACIIKIILG